VYVGLQWRISVYNSYHCHVGGVLCCSNVTSKKFFLHILQTVLCGIITCQNMQSANIHSTRNFRFPHFNSLVLSFRFTSK